VHSTESFLDKKYTRHNGILRPYKTTGVQVTEEGNYMRRLHFCNWFLQAVHNGIFYLKLTFFTDKDWFHLTGCINMENSKTVANGAVLI
jgi:hypothetical protein